MKGITLLPLFLCAAIACAHEHDHAHEPEHEHEHEHEHEGEGEHGAEAGPAELHLEPGQAESWGVEVGPPLRTRAGLAVTLPGEVALNQNRTTRITVVAPGQVASLSADLGSRLRPGDVLLTLNSPEYLKAKAEYLRLLGRVAADRVEYERARLLFQERALEERELLRRRATFEEASTALGAAAAVLQAFGIAERQLDGIRRECEDMLAGGGTCQVGEARFVVTSPLGGTVIQRDAVLGDFVEPDRVLFTITDLDSVWVRLDARETDLPHLVLGAEVVIHSPVYPEQTFSGRIAHIGAVLDERLRTVPVRVAAASGGGRLRPGLFVEGRVLAPDRARDVLAVPDAAVLRLDGERVVFVQHAPDPAEPHAVFSPKHVRIGERVGDLRIITEGLTGTELVVLKGAFTLQGELNKSVGGHGHVH